MKRLVVPISHDRTEAHGRAKLETGARKDVRVALGKCFPDAICWSIAAYVQ